MPTICDLAIAHDYLHRRIGPRQSPFIEISTSVYRFICVVFKFKYNGFITRRPQRVFSSVSFPGRTAAAPAAQVKSTECALEVLNSLTMGPRRSPPASAMRYHVVHDAAQAATMPPSYVERGVNGAADNAVLV
jgi:hypothetical protein